MSSALIINKYDGKVFHFREDGYFNMTKAAKEFGKRIDNFFANASAQEYISALESLVPGIPLIKTRRGNGLLPHVGTWGHPKLAVFFARWLDVKFAVFCDMVIDDILNKKAELTITKPEDSMAMRVPLSFAEALRLAAELAEQNEKLASEEMHDELNLLAVDQYRALTRC